MNEPGNDFQDASAPMNNADAVEGLRRQMNLLFGGLVIVSFTVTAYLGLQARRASLDLMAVAPRADEAVKASQQDLANMQPIFAKLTDFARTHPDFQKQILSRYTFNPKAVTAPTPAPTPAKK